MSRDYKRVIAIERSFDRNVNLQIGKVLGNEDPKTFLTFSKYKPCEGWDCDWTGAFYYWPDLKTALIYDAQTKSLKKVATSE